MCPHPPKKLKVEKKFLNFYIYAKERGAVGGNLLALGTDKTALHWHSPADGTESTGKVLRLHFSF